MRTIHIMGDVDEIFHPWADTVHEQCRLDGLHSGQPWSQWEMYLDYGVDKDTWLESVARATAKGLYSHTLPIYGSVEAWNRLRWHFGDRAQLHLVTARGTKDYPGSRLVREQTEEWVVEFGIAHDSLTFAKDKAAAQDRLGVRFDAAVDDSPRNCEALIKSGVKHTRLMTAAHNTHINHIDRVETLDEFVDHVVKEFG